MSAKYSAGTDELNHIPNELMQFVNRDSYSLLIKGNAGTGKTTLALTILKILNIRENFQYISTRVSPSQMYQYYPWLEKHFNASKQAQTLDEENESELPIFVDARLDEPSSMFERITNQLMDVGSPMIIIDTWDAISYFMDKEAVMNNARVLQTWRERAKAKMIFISDNPQDTTFDVLVDGIVDLSQKYHNDRLLRKITITKMRGIKINHPSYKFTLNNGAFRSFEPYNPSDFTVDLVPKSSQKNELLEGHLIKSGNSELDGAIGGGFPLKTTASISLGPNVNWKVALAFLSQTISNFLSDGNSVLCRCSALEADYVKSYTNVALPHSKALGGLIFANEQKYQKPPKTHKTQSFSEMAKKLKAKNPNKLLLCVIFSDSASGIVGKDSHELKQLSDLTIVVNTDSQESASSVLSKYSDVGVSFLEINGTLFIQSDIPWSHLFGIVVEKDAGQSHIRLVPVV